MMKFENTAQLGDRLKALDFRPMDDRPDRFVVGTVIKRHEFGEMRGDISIPFSCYIVKCEESSHGQYEIGEEVFVPYETAFSEYDERVQKL
jgi:hypothetical protein